MTGYNIFFPAVQILQVRPTQVLWGGDFHGEAQCDHRWKRDRSARICHLWHHSAQNGPRLHQVLDIHCILTLPEEGLLGYISPRNFPEALKWNLEDSWDFPWVSGCKTHGLEKYLRHWDGFPRTLLVMVEHGYNRLWDGTQNVKRYRYGYFFR